MMQKNGNFAADNAAYVDELYKQYCADPASVDDTWRAYFAGFDFGATTTAGKTASGGGGLQALIHAYRVHGHKEAQLDPLGLKMVVPCLALKPESYGLTADNARDTVKKMRQIYCQTLGAEYQYLNDPAEVEWIQAHLESPDFLKPFSSEERLALLKILTAAEGLEKYLGLKYVGQKRFSIEGGEALLALLQTLVQDAGQAKVQELVIGMAHRGRLNILVNLLGKAPEDLFGEFEGKHKDGLTGDVKYHAGFSSHIKTDSGNIIQLAMGFNPSHLEIVGPVVEGSVRARQHRRHDTERNQVLPVVIHGDAAFAGQGVVMEMLSFSQTRGFKTGGTVRIIMNNQIGFTTSKPIDARSSYYCTDIAKMIDSPVFHVNADDPEMVIRVVKLAFDFRMRFHRDVVVDLIGYRRNGHNEADEPSITQPLMYDVIRKKPTIRKIYADQLIKDAVLTQDDVDAMALAYRDTLDAKQSPVAGLYKGDYPGKRVVDWKAYRHTAWDAPVDTRVAPETLLALAQKMITLPADFTLHPTVKKLFADYEKMRMGELPITWGYAEVLAYATLLEQNDAYNIRFSGQDCGRGTFSHRHAVLHDFQTGKTYTPLEHIAKEKNAFRIIDSLLSEEAVLGFEYGYASTEPNALVIWEGQFGDFANGAQVVIDQFLSSGEQKWGQLAGLVMLLPHGQEGQGPEHSSARLERYLQLCAQDNMQVCVPTTPAQIFHLLRRQMLRPFHKPLIVMTPKSLLRNRLAVSTLDDLASGSFQLVLPESDHAINPEKVKKIIVCTGKVYYDLFLKREELKRDDVAILRIEQLYPFPEAALETALALYSKAIDVVWCQEEPQNQGAWMAIHETLIEQLAHGQSLTYAGLPAMAAPAVGSAKLCGEQQKAFIAEALA